MVAPARQPLRRADDRGRLRVLPRRAGGRGLVAAVHRRGALLEPLHRGLRPHAARVSGRADRLPAAAQGAGGRLRALDRRAGVGAAVRRPQPADGRRGHARLGDPPGHRPGDLRRPRRADIRDRGRARRLHPLRAREALAGRDAATAARDGAGAGVGHLPARGAGRPAHDRGGQRPRRARERHRPARPRLLRADAVRVPVRTAALARRAGRRGLRAAAQARRRARRHRPARAALQGAGRPLAPGRVLARGLRPLGRRRRPAGGAARRRRSRARLGPGRARRPAASARSSTTALCARTRS